MSDDNIFDNIEGKNEPVSMPTQEEIKEQLEVFRDWLREHHFYNTANRILLPQDLWEECLKIPVADWKLLNDKVNDKDK